MKSIIILAFILFNLNASEEIPTKEEISKLYVATFNRAPDSGGLDYWLNDSGLNLNQIAQSFFDQIETQNLYPNTTTTREFVQSVYNNLFNRNPDIEGWDYWIEQLEKGNFQRSQFILAAINGALDNENGQDKTILENKNEVGIYFANSGLNDQNEAKIIMKTITSYNDSVTIAKLKLDHFGSEPQNEPYYKYLWHFNSYNNILNTYGYTIDNEADINIEDAWKLSKGEGVTIAIIDDGINLGHEDLPTNIIGTYNADTQTSDVQYYPDFEYPASHGNTCAGFAASPINDIGTVGAAPYSNILIIKLDSSSIYAMIRAFDYAQTHGAKVISCSWGTNSVSEALVTKLKEVYDEGITVVFAAGNDSADMDTMYYDDESEVQWVIGVGASSEENEIASYSNYGYNIDIIAPGGDYDISTGILGLDDMDNQGYTDQLGLVNQNYSFTSGTSFSTPITAGIIALMYSVNPNLTPAEIRTILINTADKIGATTYGLDGFDTQKYRAYGKINANKAVEASIQLLRN